MTKEAKERKMHTMGTVHDYLAMWQCSQNVHGTQKESNNQNKPMTAVGKIADMEEIFRSSWSLVWHGGAAAFTFPERSLLPAPLSAKELPGGQTQILNVRQIRIINCHPVESD